jgi:hypothetical protein
MGTESDFSAIRGVFDGLVSTRDHIFAIVGKIFSPVVFSAMRAFEVS